MTSSTVPYPIADHERRGGFTLIELILVMALLAIAASLSAPRMAAFFRGRALDQEARRLLSLTHYAASRAAGEGVPVRLWVDPASGSYGLESEAGFARTADRLIEYQIDRDLSLETLAAIDTLPYEEELAARPVRTPRDGILFHPDGLIDPSSVSRITVRQADEGALCLVPTLNGLAYELVHEADLPPR